MLSCAVAFESAMQDPFKGGGIDGGIVSGDGEEEENEILVEDAWKRLQLALNPPSHDDNDDDGGSSSSSSGSSSDDDDSSSSSSSSLKAALRMNLTKKEAQGKLSAEDFKLWKKAQRSMRKSASSSNSNYYEDGDNWYVCMYVCI